MRTDIAVRVRDVAAVHIGWLDEPAAELRFMRSVLQELWFRQPDAMHRAIVAGIPVDEVAGAFGIPAAKAFARWRMLARYMTERPHELPHDYRPDWSPADIAIVESAIATYERRTQEATESAERQRQERQDELTARSVAQETIQRVSEQTRRRRSEWG